MGQYATISKLTSYDKTSKLKPQSNSKFTTKAYNSNNNNNIRAYNLLKEYNIMNAFTKQKLVFPFLQLTSITKMTKPHDNHYIVANY